MTHRPNFPIPLPQRGTEPNTWAHETISTRFKNIASRILVENEFSPEIEKRVRKLIDEIPDGPLREIDDPNAPDLENWNQFIQPFVGMDWFHPPWLLTEHYFYRRIMEAVGYFQPDSNGFQVDPFRHQKQSGLEVARDQIHQLCSRTASWRKSDPLNHQKLLNLLYLDLWGNQADLSLWPAEDGGKPDHTDIQEASSHILADDSVKVVDLILAWSPEHARLDILVDNAGFELISDLALADYCLTTKIVSTIKLHVKGHPTYVSDATKIDVLDSVSFLIAENHAETQKAGRRLLEACESGQLVIQPDFFWNSPLDAWKMPARRRNDFSQSNLVISKGDANYRRLLGDRHWPFESPFEDVIAYFPAPLVALRTLKSELVVGMQPGQAESVAVQDPDWLVDGRWGVVQFYKG